MRLFKKKFGIAFSGGGVRGLAEIGAWKALEENNIPFADMVTGTSVGSIIGSCYALGYRSDEVYDFALGIGSEIFKSYSMPQGDLREKFSYFMANRSKLFSLTKSSENIEKMIRAFYGKKTFDDTLIPFYVVTTDLISGKEIQINSGELAVVCRASSSAPGVFSPTTLDDMILVDGFILNNLPSDILKNNSIDVVLGIDVESDAFSPCKSTKFIDLLLATFDIATSYGRIKNRDLCDVLVMPELSSFSKFKIDQKKMKEMYEIGREAMQEKIPDLKALLKLRDKKIFSFSKKNNTNN